MFLTENALIKQISIPCRKLAKRSSFLIIIFLIGCNTTSKENAAHSKTEYNVFSLDEDSFIQLVESKSSPSDFKNDDILIYNNVLSCAQYQNDRLVVDKLDNNTKTTFKSSYYFSNDTLIILGQYGLFEGTGFKVRIHNKDTLITLFEHDDFPFYKSNIDSEPQNVIEVKSKKHRLRIVGEPSENKGHLIYGYLELSSDNYYTRERDQWVKTRIDLIVHFKSRFLMLDAG